MMNMDIAVLGAATSLDATSASAEASASAADAFAALLNEAAGMTVDGSVPASASGKTSAEEEDTFDEMAAMAMTSLLPLGIPIAPPPDAITVDKIASDTECLEDTTLAAISSHVGRVDVDIDVQPQAADRTEDDEAPVTPMLDVTAQTTAPDDTDSEAPIAAEPEPVAKAVIETPARVVDTANAKESRSETAGERRDEADAKPVTKPGPGSKPSRAEHGRALRAEKGSAPRAAGPQDALARAVQDAAATQTAAETRGTERAQAAIDAHAPASTAARFARALERAAIAASETNASVSAATMAAGPSSGSGQQQAFGDGSTDRTMEPFTALRHSNGGISLTMATPTMFDVRTLSRAVEAASHTVDLSPITIPERDVVAQLVQSLRVQFRDGIGEAVVTLKPEHLGSVQVSLKIENGAIKATVQAEVAAVRQWLESQQDTLRTSLAEQGLRLERFVVQPDGQRQSKGDDAQERELRRRHNLRARSAAMSGKDHPVFEITV